MIDVAVEGLPHGVHIVVLDPKLLAGLADDGSDEGVVCLDDSWEEVVSRLVVQGTREHTPEPAVRGIVQCGGHLQLRPAEGGGGRGEGGGRETELSIIVVHGIRV